MVPSKGPWPDPPLRHKDKARTWTAQHTLGASCKKKKQRFCIDNQTKQSNKSNERGPDNSRRPKQNTEPVRRNSIADAVRNQIYPRRSPPLFFEGVCRFLLFLGFPVFLKIATKHARPNKSKHQTISSSSVPRARSEQTRTGESEPRGSLGDNRGVCCGGRGVGRGRLTAQLSASRRRARLGLQLAWTLL